MAPNTILTFLTPIFLLLSPTYAWVATQYYSWAVISNDGESYTATTPVVPTAAVTPFSTLTGDIPGDELTLIQLLISGSNLPLSSIPPFSYNTEITSQISSVYYAPATITQPPSCTQTKFSYVTPMSVSPPAIMFQSPNSLTITSSTAYMTTSFYLNADGQPTSSHSWSEIDYYLAPGQCLPDLDVDTGVMLGFCQDPRGCYLDIDGAGCSTTPGTQSGVTSHGSAGTAAATEASASATKNVASGRMAPTMGEGWLVGMVVCIAGIFGVMIVL